MRSLVRTAAATAAVASCALGATDTEAVAGNNIRQPTLLELYRGGAGLDVNVSSVSGGTTWPEFNLTFRLPRDGMRVTGSKVPLQVSVNASIDPPLYGNECCILFSDAPTGLGTMTIGAPLSTYLNRTYTYTRGHTHQTHTHTAESATHTQEGEESGKENVEEEQEPGYMATEVYPLFYTGEPVCVSAWRRHGHALCYHPTLLPGPRRAYVRVDCRDPSSLPTAPLTTIASQYVDFYASSQDPNIGDEPLAAVPLYVKGGGKGAAAAADAVAPGGGVAGGDVNIKGTVDPTGRRPAPLTVDWQEDEHTQATRYCTIQRVDEGVMEECVKMVADAVRVRKDERYHAYVSALTAHLEAKGVDLPDMEGCTYSCRSKVEKLKAITADPAVRRVCEIGFNAGHSALLWLMYGHPDTTVVAFDIASHNYTHLAATWILENMGPRLQLIVGDSTLTVPAYVKMNPQAQCDVLVIDGYHADQVPLLDLQNMRALANRDGHAVIIDDIELPAVSDAMQAMVSAGQLQLLESTSGPSMPGLFQERGAEGWQVLWNYLMTSSMVIGRYL